MRCGIVLGVNDERPLAAMSGYGQGWFATGITEVWSRMVVELQ